MLTLYSQLHALETSKASASSGTSMTLLELYNGENSESL